MYMQRIAGNDVIAKIMDGVRDGMVFDEAFRHAIGKSMPVVEAQWKKDAESNMSGWSVLNDGTWGLFGGAFLFLGAWYIRRRRKRDKLAQMSDDAGEWDYEESRYPLPGARRP
jgi:uncharacterized protein YjiS (DUF1127 family)